MASPPLSEGHVITDDAGADLELRRRASSPSTCRPSVDPSLARGQPNRQQSEQSCYEAGQNSKLSRAHPSVKINTISDLQLTEKPVSIAFLRDFSQLTPDAAELFRRSKDAAERRFIIPMLSRDAVIDGLVPLDFQLAKDSFYDMESRAQELGVAAWSAWDELQVLKEIRNQSCEPSVSHLTEKAEIACVYNQLLAVSLKPFGTQLSYCDVSRVSINQQYLTKHPWGGHVQPKIVDLYITLSDNAIQDDSWTRLRGATDHESINHSSTNPLRSQPIAISIEIKPSDGSAYEAWARLSIWATSLLERLRALTPSSIFMDRKGVGIVLPLVWMNGRHWSLLFVRDDGDKATLIDTIRIGYDESCRMLSSRRFFAALGAMGSYGV